jgi:hypothetical protein
VSLTGDLAALSKMSASIRRLAEVPARAAPRVAIRLKRLIEGEFETGIDPYGREWTPLAPATLAKRSQTTEPPLTDHGDMARSLVVVPRAGAGVSITIDHPAAPNQTGWHGPLSDGPSRRILPLGTLPVAWREAIDEVVDQTVRGK